MINPKKITAFNLTHPKLEEVLLFWVCAAGKNATTSAKCLDDLLSYLNFGCRKYYHPFRFIKNYVECGGDLAKLLKEFGIGCYNHKAETFKQLAFSKLNLKTCSLSDLENIKGIGAKTARCFLMHSRRNVRAAGLDTHVKKYLRDCGYLVPKTLSSKQYLKYENIFLKIVDDLGEQVADFDLRIWNYYSGRADKPIPLKIMDNNDK